MAKKIKGFLFGISLFLVAITILTITVLITKSQKTNIDLATDLAKADRLYDLSSSMEESFKEIFNVASGISIWINNKDTLFFREELPSKYIPKFVQNYSSFQTFIANLPQTEETITLFNIDSNLPLIINPAKITYTHAVNTINVNPNTFNFPGYNITIESKCALTFTPGTYTLGAMKFDITTIDPVNGKVPHPYTLDPTVQSTFTLPTVSPCIYTTTINVGGSPQGKLSIFYESSSNPINVTTGILLYDPGQEQLTVEYPSKIYNVSIPKFETFHSNNVKLKVFDPLIAAQTSGASCPSTLAEKNAACDSECGPGYVVSSGQCEISCGGGDWVCDCTAIIQGCPEIDCRICIHF